MDTVDSIRRVGFRKWYERQLIWGHLYFLLCIVGLILVAAAIELYAGHAARAELAGALVMGFAGVVGTALGWERYRRIMIIAEHLGAQATCANCQAYGRFEITAAGAALKQEPVNIRDAEELWLSVHCRKCGNEWRM